MQIQKILKEKKYFVAIIIIIIIGGFTVSRFLPNDDIKNGEITILEKGTIIQDVSVTGQVKKGDKINLSFLSNGRIKSVYVEVGERVKRGDILAKLDTRNLEIQLQEAIAGLALSQSKLDKLIAGATAEEISLSQTKVANAKNNLTKAQKTLEKTKFLAIQTLQNYYDLSLDDIRDSFLKSDNAFNDIDIIKRDYFYFTDQVSIGVQNNVKIIEESKAKINTTLNSLSSDSTGQEIENALISTENNLEEISNAISIIRNFCEDPYYRGIVSSMDKTTIDTHRLYMNAILSSIRIDKNNIFTTKATNELNIVKAESSVVTTQATLEELQRSLDLLLADPRKEDVIFAEAGVNQVKAKVSLLERNIIDSSIFSPVDGQIVNVNRKEGEIVDAVSANGVFILIPETSFEVEMQISEVDAAKVKIGNKTKIKLDALIDLELEGHIIEMDPSGTDISGVIYYTTKTSLESENDLIKPEMTANVTIFTQKKDDVIIIPLGALIFREDKKVVRIIENKEIKEVEVTTGLMNTMGSVEITSGLNPGDKLFYKQK